MKRILISGASGFIGSHAARIAQAQGHEVGVLTRDRSVLQRPAFKPAAVFELNSERLAGELAQWKADSCVHLGWYAEPGKYLESPTNLDCLSSSLALLRALFEAGCKHVVLAGTCAEYDTANGYLRESSPTAPNTLYAASKLSLKLIAEQLARAAGTTVAWGRIFYLYGSGEDPRRVVPAVIQALLNGKPFPASKGTQIRDYLHVEDVASAFVRLAETQAAGDFNISSGDPVSMTQLLLTIGEQLNHPELIRFGEAPERPWDPPFIVGDNRRLLGQGWSPRYNLKDGLARTIEELRQAKQGNHG